MKITTELEKEDFNSLHDVILDALDFKPNDEQIQNYWNLTPDNIKTEAIHWGVSDTVFRDNFYIWLLEKCKIK